MTAPAPSWPHLDRNALLPFLRDVVASSDRSVSGQVPDGSAMPWGAAAAGCDALWADRRGRSAHTLRGLPARLPPAVIGIAPSPPGGRHLLPAANRIILRPGEIRPGASIEAAAFCGTRSSGATRLRAVALGPHADGMRSRPGGTRDERAALRSGVRRSHDGQLGINPTVESGISINRVDAHGDSQTAAGSTSPTRRRHRLTDPEVPKPCRGHPTCPGREPAVCSFENAPSPGRWRAASDLVDLAVLWPLLSAAFLPSVATTAERARALSHRRALRVL